MYWEGGGGFLISNNKSDFGTIVSYIDCVEGTYSFTYSFDGGSYSGSFYLDGKKDFYTLVLCTGQNFFSIILPAAQPPKTLTEGGVSRRRRRFI